MAAKDVNDDDDGNTNLFFKTITGKEFALSIRDDEYDALTFSELFEKIGEEANLGDPERLAVILMPALMKVSSLSQCGTRLVKHYLARRKYSAWRDEDLDYAWFNDLVTGEEGFSWADHNYLRYAGLVLNEHQAGAIKFRQNVVLDREGDGGWVKVPRGYSSAPFAVLSSAEDDPDEDALAHINVFFSHVLWSRDRKTAVLSVRFMCWEEQGGAGQPLVLDLPRRFHISDVASADHELRGYDESCTFPTTGPLSSFSVSWCMQNRIEAEGLNQTEAGKEVFPNDDSNLTQLLGPALSGDCWFRIQPGLRVKSAAKR